MSFSREVKSELCRSEHVCGFCAAAECYGILLYCNTFTGAEIRIVTESRDFADALPALFGSAFGSSFDSAPPPDAGEGKLTLSIGDSAKLDAIFETYGLSRGGVLAHHINLGALESECCRRAFVRGAFLAGGSVTDPGKGYHLELVTSHYSVNREMRALLLDLDLAPKEVGRKGNHAVYFKRSGAIEDFLTLAGAPVAAMALMSAKIEKSMRNSVNRRVNCDTANVSKTVDASGRQLLAITRLGGEGGLSNLPEKLRETAALRLRHPELSLGQLGEMCTPPVSKSCISHRMRAIIAAAASEDGDNTNKTS
jgi:DNA-binding protein WhiA